MPWVEGKHLKTANPKSENAHGYEPDVPVNGHDYKPDVSVNGHHYSYKPDVSVVIRQRTRANGRADKTPASHFRSPRFKFVCNKRWELKEIKEKGKCGKGLEENMWVTIRHEAGGDRGSNGKGVRLEGNELLRWGGGRKKESSRKQNDE
jgi:hypothetical protein